MVPVRCAHFQESRWRSPTTRALTDAGPALIPVFHPKSTGYRNEGEERVHAGGGMHSE